MDEATIQVWLDLYYALQDFASMPRILRSNLHDNLDIILLIKVFRVCRQWEYIWLSAFDLYALKEGDNACKHVFRRYTMPSIKPSKTWSVARSALCLRLGILRTISNYMI